jgi:NADPH:quinone reductase-like Zn-dependent oxidoreductase
VGDPSDKAKPVEKPRAVPNKVGDSEVLVEMSAAALNPTDYKLATGRLAVIASPPFVSGFGFVGTVSEAGAKSGFEKGQEGFGDVPNRKEDSPYGGSLSSFILVPADKLAVQPTGLSDEEGACLALVGATVLDCLTQASPSGGARVLVLGTLGGVGSTAVQIMKACGLHVVGVCSGKNAEMVTGLGVDVVIDYTADAWEEKLSTEEAKVEIVFDFPPSGAHSTSTWEKSN